MFRYIDNKIILRNKENNKIILELPYSVMISENSLNLKNIYFGETQLFDLKEFKYKKTEKELLKDLNKSALCYFIEKDCLFLTKVYKFKDKPIEYYI